MNLHVFSKSIRKRGIYISLAILYYEVVFDILRKTITRSSKVGANGSQNYMPSSYFLVTQLLDKLFTWILPEQICFVDYGSGTGRILLIALEKGIKTIYGIEIDCNLSKMAKQNIVGYQKKVKHFDINLLNCNAVDFYIPANANVFYFYNPFDNEIFDKVLKKIVSHAAPELYIIYLNPVCHDSLLKYGFTAIFHLKSQNYTEAIIYHLARL